MVKKCQFSRSSALEVYGVAVEPTPNISRVRNLRNLDSLRLEMTRVYRDMRNQAIATQDGARMVYVLAEIRKCFELVELEKRIALLESSK
jgi:hypothetical protein